MNYIAVVREFLKEKRPTGALLQNVKDTLDHCSDVYYNTGEDSPLTDEEFDMVLQKYRKYDKVTAGAAPKAGKRVVDVGHDFPEIVGTLDKVNFVYKADRLAAGKDDLDSVEEWFARAVAAAKIKSNRIIRVVVTDKKDGNSIAETRNDQLKLITALTRGKDGQGADMTNKFSSRKPPRVPVPVGDTVGIKYEAIVNDSDFQKICEEMGREFANSRSLTAGILGADKSESGKYVDMITLVPIRVRYKNTPLTREEELAIIENIRDFSADQKISMNIERIHGTVPDVIAKVKKIYDRYNSGDRQKLDHPIDGLVVEIIDEDIRKALGRDDDRNNFEFALKFPYMVKRTTVSDIKFYVGLTGRITPVVLFDTVQFNGANCSHVSIANYKRFKELALCKGDYVFIEYRNDVLSYLTKDPETRSRGKCIEFPKACPECGTGLKFNKSGTFAFCPNKKECPGIQRGKIVNWFRKLNIKGVKESTVRKLMEGGLITHIQDLYSLTAQQIAELEGFQLRSGELIVKAVNSRREMWDWELFGSLHFEGVGRSKCKLIFKEYTIKDVFAMIKDKTYVEKLSAIRGIESATAKSFARGVVENQSTIVFVKTNLKVKSTKSEGSAKKASNVYSFVFTGFRDPELQAQLEEAGHSVKSSVSKNIDILVAKSTASNSGKVKQARDLGKAVISLDDLRTNLPVYLS